MLASIARILLGGLVLYVLLMCMMYLFQEKLIFFPQKLAADHTFSFSSSVEEHFLQVSGAKLNVLVFEKAKARGTILYFHGNAGSLDSWGEVYSSFRNLPYNFVIFDYRGYGKSGGKIGSEKQLQADAEALYRFVSDRYPGQEIILYGRSIGTGIASWLAAQHSPKMLILETPYYSLPDMVAQIYPFVPSFLVKYKLRNDVWTQSRNYPIHIFHGDRDQLIPYKCSERLQTRDKNIVLHTVPGAGHNDISNFPFYHKALDKLLSL